MTSKIKLTPRGDGKDNFYEVNLSGKNGSTLRLTLIVDGTGTYMEFDPKQADNLIASLIEYRAKLPK